MIEWGADGTPERLRIGDLPATKKWVRLEVPVAKLKLKPGTAIDGWAFTQHGGTVYWDKAGIATQIAQDGQLFDSLPAWVRAQRASGSAGLPAEYQGDRHARAVSSGPTPRPTSCAATSSNMLMPGPTRLWNRSAPSSLKPSRRKKQLIDQIPTTLVFREKTGEPKPAYLLKRGEYDQRGEKVGRAVPAFLPPLPPGAPVNRLGLAQWLIAPNHPSTARVAVNRFWLQVFGTGIVKTAEDFGSQGEPPSHPELLDWLAVQFREDGWDVKRLMKRLVMSATYRQSSRVTPRIAGERPGEPAARSRSTVSARCRDPSRPGAFRRRPFGRNRRWAERQTASAVGSLGSRRLHRQQHGPFQGRQRRAKIHRRSFYTFWKRTSPPPQMTTFDAPSREACQVRRERTNTPLQALLMMNEPQFIEAARGLAERTLREAGGTADDRLAYMFRLVTLAPPDSKDLAELRAAFNDLSAHYMKQPEAAKQLIAIGETKPDPRFNPGELAAWTMIGNVILNLDEVITKG